jgi:SAM-dependent methyltransferase
VTGRLPDGYFDEMYAAARDPWRLEERWYDQRKYAITMAMLPRPRYRHAFEPGCSVGVLTALLSQRCDRVTATDVAAEALASARGRLAASGRSEAVTLLRSSVDAPWPADVDLVVLSEVGYYLDGPSLRSVLTRECPRLGQGATLIAAHWRHRVDDYPLTGDEANNIVAQAPGLHRQAHYLDDDVDIGLFSVGATPSVAADTDVPGACTPA